MIPTDISGNQLIVNQDGNLIVVFLKFNNPYLKFNHPRKLGIINCLTRILTTYRNREIHLHRNKWAYGWNEQLMKEGKRFDKILVNEKFGKEKHSYLIPKSIILEKGEPATIHQRGGFERQIFLNFELIKTFEIQ